jgi:hypothetical protein
MRGNNLIIDVLGVLADVTLVIWHHHLLLLLLLWHLLVTRLAPDTGWVLWHGIVLVQGACPSFGTGWAEGF